MSNHLPKKGKPSDWRLDDLARDLAATFSPEKISPYPSDNPPVETASFQCGGELIEVEIPSAVALFLDLSWQRYEEASLSLQKCLVHKDSHGHVPNGDAFTFYQRIFSSVVFACTSLEAFANEAIPDSYVHLVNEKNFTRSYNKEQIERNLNLDTKLGDVLPAALAVPTPKGGREWNDYSKLRELRDRVIHMKLRDRASVPPSIWCELMSHPLPETFQVAKKLMNYFFVAKGATPRWFQQCPF